MSTFECAGEWTIHEIASNKAIVTLETIKSATLQDNGDYIHEVVAEDSNDKVIHTKEPDNKETIIETLEYATKVLQRELDYKDGQIEGLIDNNKTQREIIAINKETIKELHSQINSLKEKLEKTKSEKVKMSSVYGEGGRTSFTPIKVDKFNMDAIETPFSIHRRGTLMKFAADGTIAFTSDD